MFGVVPGPYIEALAHHCRFMRLTTFHSFKIPQTLSDFNRMENWVRELGNYKNGLHSSPWECPSLGALLPLIPTATIQVDTGSGGSDPKHTINQVDIRQVLGAWSWNYQAWL